MNWWQKLKNNQLARFGAIVLLLFYIAVIGADFFAPYRPCDSYDVSQNACDIQPNTSLLPPTKIFWRIQEGPQKDRWIGPHVYPTTQGPTSLATGDRELTVNWQKPSPLRLFVQGSPYELWQIRLPLPPSFDEVEIFSGFRGNLHLFGTVGEGKIHLLGTDEGGRDQFSRILHGGKISLFIGLFGICVSFPLGMFIGGISGYFGGWTDAILMRLVEVLMTIPSIYLLVALNVVLPPGLSSTQRFILIVLITSFISWSGLARVIRGQVLSLKEQEFVQAARAMGAKPFYIILRHILPQTASYIVISATLSVPGFIVAESVLSLIGLGIQQPDPSWGNLLSLSTNASIIIWQPWLVWPPALLIIITVLAFNILGDGLRDALDPRSLE